MKVESAYEYYKNVGTLEELTISYLLRKRNSFIEGGLSYGEKLGEFLLNKGIVKRGGYYIILEVGPGYGDMGKCLTDFFDKKHVDFSYILLDCSKNLIKVARNKKIKNSRFLISDALALPFKKNSVDLIISNEVAGDLINIRDFEPGKTQLDRVSKDAGDMVKRYFNPEKLPKKFNFNYGALKLVFESRRVLKRGGKLVMVENSCENRINGSGWPEKLSLSTHSEYRIKFTHVETLATRLGMKLVERGSLNSILRVKDRPFVFLQDEDGVEVLNPEECDIPFKSHYRNSIKKVVEQFEYVIIER